MNYIVTWSLLLVAGAVGATERSYPINMEWGAIRFGDCVALNKISDEGERRVTEIYRDDKKIKSYWSVESVLVIQDVLVVSLNPQTDRSAKIIQYECKAGKEKILVNPTLIDVPERNGKFSCYGPELYIYDWCAGGLRYRYFDANCQNGPVKKQGRIYSVPVLPLSNLTGNNDKQKNEIKCPSDQGTLNFPWGVGLIE
jgi:hypothetical protein